MDAILASSSMPFPWKRKSRRPSWTAGGSSPMTTTGRLTGGNTGSKSCACYWRGLAMGVFLSDHSGREPSYGNACRGPSLPRAYRCLGRIRYIGGSFAALMPDIKASVGASDAGFGAVLSMSAIGGIAATAMARELYRHRDKWRCLWLRSHAKGGLEPASTLPVRANACMVPLPLMWEPSAWRRAAVSSPGIGRLVDGNSLRCRASRCAIARSDAAFP